MKSIKYFGDFEGRIALLRLDLNVPLKKNKAIDETRINKIIPTVKFLLKKNLKILIVSHIGRPKGKKIKSLSLQPVCKSLEKKIRKNVKLLKKNIHSLSKYDLFKNYNNKIIFLENIRFYSEEEKNQENFAKHLASLADIYVNDAFSCSHRSHASVSKITKFLPSYIGLQFESEVNALKKITLKIKKPITCIIGGSKISSKIMLIKNLIKKFDSIIFVGGMANNILKFKGIFVGNSLVEKNCEKTIRDIFQYSKKYSCSIYYPIDVLVGKHLKDKSKIKQLNTISSDDMILDIGPKTIIKINSIIKNSNTLLWNGPAGYFENPKFSKGSTAIAKAISTNTKNNSLYSVAGGGETISIINKTKTTKNFNFVSTAGGAFLEYLEGKKLPGIKALY